MIGCVHVLKVYLKDLLKVYLISGQVGIDKRNARSISIWKLATIVAPNQC